MLGDLFRTIVKQANPRCLPKTQIKHCNLTIDNKPSYIFSMRITISQVPILTCDLSGGEVSCCSLCKSWLGLHVFVICFLQPRCFSVSISEVQERKGVYKNSVFILRNSRTWPWESPPSREHACEPNTSKMSH